MPTLQRSFEGKAQILCTSPLAKLEIGSPDYTDLPPFLSRFKDKEMMKQIEVGSDTKKGLAKVDKGRNMKDQVGI